MTIQKISTGYTPRAWQEYVHASLRRFNVLVLHRRSGKTVLAVNDKIDRAMANPLLNPQYAYIGATYGQAKRVAWDYFKYYTRNIPGVTTNESDLRIDIPRPWLPQKDRVRIMLLGAENPDSIRGIYLDGATLDEFGLMPPDLWGKVVRPTLSDRIGWATFLGTPNGQNHFYEMYSLAREQMQSPDSNWFMYMLKASESGILPQTELDDARMTMSEDEYNQEYECSFSAALKGAYYAREMERMEKQKRATQVPYDRATTVSTAWDLGINDTTAIWFFQLVGKEIHLIDYVEDSGIGLDYYVKVIKEKKYNYDEHLLPHDAAARELGTGKTRIETLRSLGLQRLRVIPKQDREDGINAARMILDRCWFDATRVARGIDALKNYQRKWDAKNQVYSLTPLHNWASNGADAFRTLALGIREERRAQIHIPKRAITDYDIYGHTSSRFGRY